MSLVVWAHKFAFPGGTDVGGILAELKFSPEPFVSRCEWRLFHALSIWRRLGVNARNSSYFITSHELPNFRKEFLHWKSTNKWKSSGVIATLMKQLPGEKKEKIPSFNVARRCVALAVSVMKPYESWSKRESDVRTDACALPSHDWSCGARAFATDRWHNSQGNLTQGWCLYRGLNNIITVSLTCGASCKHGNESRAQATICSFSSVVIVQVE